MPTDLSFRLQALLAHLDEMAQDAARKLEKSREPTAGAFYAGVMFGYEDCADKLARVLSEVLAQGIDTQDG